MCSVLAVTVVATSEVVPRRATLAATAPRASGVDSITSWPPAPWICTSTNPGTTVIPGAEYSCAPGGSRASRRAATATGSAGVFRSWNHGGAGIRGRAYPRRGRPRRDGVNSGSPRGRGGQRRAARDHFTGGHNRDGQHGTHLPRRARDCALHRRAAGVPTKDNPRGGDSGHTF